MPIPTGGISCRKRAGNELSENREDSQTRPGAGTILEHRAIPFTVDEQNLIIDHLPKHYRPYFQTAFRVGLRQGEQLALRTKDADLDKGELHIRHGFTLDEHCKVAIVNTKNIYSRRTIQLLPAVVGDIQPVTFGYEAHPDKYQLSRWCYDNWHLRCGCVCLSWFHFRER
jgi:integrase